MFLLFLLPPANEVGEGCFYTCLSFCSREGGVDPPGRHPPPPPEETRKTPPRKKPGRPSPRSSACWEIRETSGRYASYWNACLFFFLHFYISYFVLLFSLPFTPFLDKQCSSILIPFITDRNKYNGSTWREQFLVPLPLYNPVYTIVIYG